MSSNTIKEMARKKIRQFPFVIINVRSKERELSLLICSHSQLLSFLLSEISCLMIIWGFSLVDSGLALSLFCYCL